MSILIQLRQAELKSRITGLDAELSDWIGRTDKDPLKRHHSQMLRIAKTLKGLLSTFGNDSHWDKPTDQVFLENVSKWEMLILTAYSAWDVFRAKLALRQDPFFGDLLAACDDLLWECYEPAMLTYAPGKRPPPLVYLNTTWSPMLRKRESSFESDVQAGRDPNNRAMHSGAYLETIQKLPIPLLGLPWFQVAHLPSALLIAHEAGHAVDYDFNLNERVQAVLKVAGLNEPYEWSLCSREVFADLYACLCLGRYAASALLDINVLGPKIVEGESFGAYPPTHLRVRLLVQALKFLELPADAKAIQELWEDAYSVKLPESTDVDVIVKIIYEDPELKLRSYMKPPQAKISDIAQFAVDDHYNLKQLTNARDLFCAARHIHETGTPAELALATPRLLKQIVHGHAGEYRADGKAVESKSDLENKLKAQLQSDYDAGLAWLNELGP